MSAGPHEPRTAAGRFVNAIEETAIAVLMGAMTLITFANVPIRYLFDGILLPRVEFLWAVEMTGFLFAWLVVFGISYGVKVSANLGVDALLNVMPAPLRRLCGVLAAACCLAYAALLLKGAWDFWAPFANLPPTTGRWFPTGFQREFLGQGWYEVNDTPLPGFLRFLEDWFNDGDEYEKLPRVLPYLILPVGAALLLLRFAQATLRLLRGDIPSLIAAHEAEDLVEEAARRGAARE